MLFFLQLTSICFLEIFGFSIGRYEEKRESFDPFATGFESGAIRFLGKKMAPALEPFQNMDSTLVLLL